MASSLRVIRQLFVHNWGLKLLAVTLAVLSFQAVRSVTSETMRYDLPLEVKLEPGIAIDSQDPQIVNVVFRGSKEDLGQLKFDLPRVIVRPGKYDFEGATILPVRPRDVERVRGVSAAHIEPATVTLRFDREIEMPVDVAPPRTVGMPGIGKAEISYEPTSVKIRGPKRRLERKKFLEVNTERVDVSDRIVSFTKWVRVIPPEEWVSHIDPPEIQVKVSIVTESVTRQWTNIAVIAAMKPGELKDVFLEPSAVNVALQGRAEVLERIVASSVRVFVDCADLAGAGTYELPVNVHLPKGLTVKAQVTPKTIKVVVKEQ